MEAKWENEQGRKGRERKGGRIKVNWKEGINCAEAVKIKEKGGLEEKEEA